MDLVYDGIAGIRISGITPIGPHFEWTIGMKGGFELLFDSRVIGVKKLSELDRHPDDKRKGPFDKEDNGSHLCKDSGSFSIQDSGFV